MCVKCGLSLCQFDNTYNKYVKFNREYKNVVTKHETKLKVNKSRNDKDLYKKIIRACIESGESLSSLSDKYDISRDLKEHDIVLYRMYKSR